MNVLAKFYNVHRTEISARARARRIENPAKSKIYYALHRDEKIRRSIIYASTHKEEIKIRDRVRRAKGREERSIGRMILAGQAIGKMIGSKAS